MAIQLEVRSETKQAQSDLQKLREAVGKIKEALVGIDKSPTSNLNNSLTRTRDIAKSTAPAFQQLATAIGATLAAYASLDLYIRTYDTLTNLNTRLKLATQSNAEFKRSFKDVSYIALSTRAPLEDITALYQRLSMASAQLGISQKEVAVVVQNTAKALALSGSDLQATRAAITQLGQALASGRLQGDELRSILENTPALAQAIADGLGKSIGQLRILGEEGKLTSKDVFNALLQQTDALNKSFKKVSITYGMAFNNIATSLYLVLDGIQKAFNKSTGSIPDFIASLGVSIAKFAQNLDEKVFRLEVKLTTFAVETLRIFLIIPNAISDAFTKVKETVSSTVDSLMGTKIDAMMNFVNFEKAKSTVYSWAKSVEGSFFWLYDRVIGHSWIPDLVNGVIDWFSKLTTDPVKSLDTFINKADQGFSQFEKNVGSIFDKIGNKFSSVFDTINPDSYLGRAIAVSKKYYKEFQDWFNQTSLAHTAKQMLGMRDTVPYKRRDFTTKSGWDYSDTEANVAFGPHRSEGRLKRSPFSDIVNAFDPKYQVAVAIAAYIGIASILSLTIINAFRLAISLIPAAITTGFQLIFSGSVISSTLLGLFTTVLGVALARSLHADVITGTIGKIAKFATDLFKDSVDFLIGTRTLIGDSITGTLAIVAKMALLFEAGRKFVLGAAISTAAAPTKWVNSLGAKGNLAIMNRQLDSSAGKVAQREAALDRNSGLMARTINELRSVDGTLRRMAGNTFTNDIMSGKRATLNARGMSNVQIRSIIDNAQLANRLLSDLPRLQREEERLQRQHVRANRDMMDLERTRNSLQKQVNATAQAFQNRVMAISSGVGGVLGSVAGFNLGTKIADQMVGYSDWAKVGVTIATALAGQLIVSSIGAAIGSAILFTLQAGTNIFIMPVLRMLALAFNPWVAGVAMFGALVALLVGVWKNPQWISDIVSALDSFEKSLFKWKEGLGGVIAEAVKKVNIVFDTNFGQNDPAYSPEKQKERTARKEAFRLRDEAARKEVEYASKNKVSPERLNKLSKEINWLATERKAIESMESWGDSSMKTIFEMLTEAAGVFLFTVRHIFDSVGDNIGSFMAQVQARISLKFEDANNIAMDTEIRNWQRNKAFEDKVYRLMYGVSRQNEEMPLSIKLAIANQDKRNIADKYNKREISQDTYDRSMANIDQEINRLLGRAGMSNAETIRKNLGGGNLTDTVNRSTTPEERAANKKQYDDLTANLSEWFSPSTNPILVWYREVIRLNKEAPLPIVNKPSGLFTVPDPFIEGLGNKAKSTLSVEEINKNKQAWENFGKWFSIDTNPIIAWVKEIRRLSNETQDAIKESKRQSRDTVNKATGGYISGPGSGTSDSIPAMLSNGEFVVNSKSTSRYRRLLERINKFQKGGEVKDNQRDENGGLPDSLTYVDSIEPLEKRLDFIQKLRQQIDNLTSGTGIKWNYWNNTGGLWDPRTGTISAPDLDYGIQGNLSSYDINYLTQLHEVGHLRDEIRRGWSITGYSSLLPGPEGFGNYKTGNRLQTEYIAQKFVKDNSLIRAPSMLWQNAFTVAEAYREQALANNLHLVPAKTLKEIEDMIEEFKGPFTTNRTPFNVAELRKIPDSTMGTTLADNSPLPTYSSSEVGPNDVKSLIKESLAMSAELANQPEIELANQPEIDTNKANSVPKDTSLLGRIKSWFINTFNLGSSSPSKSIWNGLGDFLSTQLSNGGSLLKRIFSGFAYGGNISGPGGPTDDKIPAMLSNGEFVVNAKATSKHRGLLQAINRGIKLPGFANGTPDLSSTIFPTNFNGTVEELIKKLEELNPTIKFSINELVSKIDKINFKDETGAVLKKFVESQNLFSFSYKSTSEKLADFAETTVKSIGSWLGPYLEKAFNWMKPFMQKLGVFSNDTGTPDVNYSKNGVISFLDENISSIKANQLRRLPTDLAKEGIIEELKSLGITINASVMEGMNKIQDLEPLLRQIETLTALQIKAYAAEGTSKAKAALRDYGIALRDAAISLNKPKPLSDQLNKVGASPAKQLTLLNNALVGITDYRLSLEALLDNNNAEDINRLIKSLEDQNKINENIKVANENNLPQFIKDTLISELKRNTKITEEIVESLQPDNLQKAFRLSPEALKQGAAGATNFQGTFQQGLVGLMKGNIGGRKFFEGLSDSFSTIVFENISKGFTESLFKGKLFGTNSLNDIFTSIFAGNFQFGDMAGNGFQKATPFKGNVENPFITAPPTEWQSGQFDATGDKPGTISSLKNWFKDLFTTKTDSVIKLGSSTATPLYVKDVDAALRSPRIPNSGNPSEATMVYGSDLIPNEGMGANYNNPVGGGYDQSGGGLGNPSSLTTGKEGLASNATMLGVGTMIGTSLTALGSMIGGKAGQIISILGMVVNAIMMVAMISALPGAKGMVFSTSGQLSTFAKGGIFSSPHLFPMANNGIGLLGEAGPEAIMPLTRLPGGKLGVKAVGSRGQSNATFNINITGDVSRQTRTEIQRMIPQIASGVNQHNYDQGYYRK